MTLINRIATRNATLWLYASAAIGYVVDIVLPSYQFESRTLAIAATVLTLAVNAVRAGMEKKET